MIVNYQNSIDLVKQKRFKTIGTCLFNSLKCPETEKDRETTRSLSDVITYSLSDILCVVQLYDWYFIIGI